MLEDKAGSQAVMSRRLRGTGSVVGSLDCSFQGFWK
jgi:hypothetical protein